MNDKRVIYQERQKLQGSNEKIVGLSLAGLFKEIRLH